MNSKKEREGKEATAQKERHGAVQWNQLPSSVLVRRLPPGRYVMWVSLHMKPTGPGLPSLPDSNSSCNLVTPLRAPASTLFPSPCHKCHHSASQTPLTRTAQQNAGTCRGHTSTDGQGQSWFCEVHQGQNKSETQRGPCGWQTWPAERGHDAEACSQLRFLAVAHCESVHEKLLGTKMKEK